MMGQLSGVQEHLFYSFNLDKHVPADHLLRRIDRFLDLDGLRNKLAEAYSPIGRPSIDSELMIRMLILGYCLGIRSERRLCEEGKAFSRWPEAVCKTNGPPTVGAGVGAGTGATVMAGISAKPTGTGTKPEVGEGTGGEALCARAFAENAAGLSLCSRQ